MIKWLIGLACIIGLSFSIIAGCQLKYDPPQSEYTKLVLEIRESIARSKDKDKTAQEGIVKMEKFLKDYPKTSHRRDIYKHMLAWVSKHVRNSDVILRVCSDYLKKYPEDEARAAYCLFKMAGVYRSLSKYTEALEQVTQLINKYSSYSNLEQAIYWKVATSYQIGRYKVCQEAGEDYLKRYKSSKEEGRKKRIGLVKHYLEKAKVGLAWQGKAPFRMRGRDILNRAFDLASWKGKVVLLVFWFPQANPSHLHKLLPLSKIYEKYGGRNFRLAAVSIVKARTPGEAKRIVEGSVMNQKMRPWIHIYSWSFSGYKRSKWARNFRIVPKRAPFTFLIDTEGKIKAIDIWGDGLEAAVGEMME